MLLIWYHTRHSFNIKKSKSFNWLCRKVLDAVCTHVASSAASRDSAVKITTDSYQLWVAH